MQGEMIDIADLITSSYGDDVIEGDIGIVRKGARQSEWKRSTVHHHTDVPEGVLAISRRTVQHHYEHVDVCTFFYEHDERVNDALKASGLAWFDRFVGGWNVPLIMDEDTGRHMAGFLCLHFESLFDIDKEETRTRKSEEVEPQETGEMHLIPFHVPVTFAQIQTAIRDLRPHDDLDVPFYVHVGGGYGEWPRQSVREDAEYADVMTRYPFLLVCYDDPADGRRYVTYSVLGTIAERIETGAGWTTRELFMRIAHTVRETKEPVIIDRCFNEAAPERPGDRAFYRGDIPTRVFDDWTAVCAWPVPHVLCSDYALPCGSNAQGLLEREAARPGRDVAPPTDLYLRRIADFFGGELGRHETFPFYADWPDEEMDFERSAKEEKEDDGKVPVLIDRIAAAGDDRTVLEHVVSAMVDRFTSSESMKDIAIIDRVVFGLLELDRASGEDSDGFSPALRETCRMEGGLPLNAEILLMVAYEINEVHHPVEDAVTGL